MDNPKVTIIIPCYNYAKFLQFSVNSALNQSFAGLEVILINDCSMDNTHETALKFTDPRVRYINHAKNIGHIATYNEAIGLARGEFILLLSADDAIYPDFLKETLDVFSKDASLGVVFTAIDIIDGLGNITRKKPAGFLPKMKSGEVSLKDILLSLNFIPHSAALVRKSAYKWAGPYDEELPYSCDWDMWLMMAKKYKVFYMDKILASYRMHAKNQSKALDSGVYSHDIIYVLNKFYLGPGLSAGLADLKNEVFSRAYLSSCHKYLASGRTICAFSCVANALKSSRQAAIKKDFYSCLLQCGIFYFVKNAASYAAKLKKALVFPFDAAIFLLFSVYLVFYCIFLRVFYIRRMRPRRSAMISLIAGMDISSMKKQMGRMGFDRAAGFNPGGYFDRMIYMYYSAQRNSRMQPDEKNIFIESKMPLGVFYLTYQAEFFYNMIDLLVAEKPTMIHSATPYETGLIGYFAGLLTDTPFCVSVRTEYDDAFRLNRADSVTIYGSRKIAKAVERFVLKKSKLVMVRSWSLAEYAAANGARPEYIKVEPFGLPVEHFIKQAPSEKQGSVVFSAGRLTPYNYFQDVVKIAKLVSEREPTVKFVIAGDGPQRLQLEASARALRIEKNIIFLGWKPLDEVSRLRASAAVNLCLKGGNSLVEAALSARPVVTYDVDWHTELIKDGQTGLVVKESDIKAAAGAVLRLLSDVVLSNRLGDNAKEAAKARHDYNTVSLEKVKWIKELVKGCAK